MLRISSFKSSEETLLWIITGIGGGFSGWFREQWPVLQVLPHSSLLMVLSQCPRLVVAVAASETPELCWGRGGSVWGQGLFWGSWHAVPLKGLDLGFQYFPHPCLASCLLSLRRLWILRGCCGAFTLGCCLRLESTGDSGELWPSPGSSPTLRNPLCVLLREVGKAGGCYRKLLGTTAAKWSVLKWSPWC